VEVEREVELESELEVVLLLELELDLGLVCHLLHTASFFSYHILQTMKYFNTVNP
jgi:hypothetical protein